MAPWQTKMLHDINEKIIEIKNTPNAGTDKLLELMNLFDDGGEEVAGLFRHLKERIDDLLTLETLQGLDGIVMSSQMLVMVMLSERVAGTRVTSVHNVYGEDGDELEFTTMDVDLVNGETINIAVVE